MSNMTRMVSKPRRTSLESPRKPCRSMSPSSRVAMPARRRVIDQRAGQAAGERVQHVFARIRPAVLGQQHFRLVADEEERLLVLHFLANAVEIVDARVVFPTANPPIGKPELEVGEGSIGFDDLDSGGQLIGINTVHDCALGYL